MTEEIKQVEETTTEEVAAETVVEAEENVEQLPAKRQRGRKKRVETQEVKPESEWKEQVVQIRRVTKVVKGGKKLSFRAIVIVGNKKGQVGVGLSLIHILNSRLLIRIMKLKKAKAYGI